MTKYNVLFTKGAMVKATSARIRTMNEIPRTRTHRSHGVVSYIVVFSHCEQDNYISSSLGRQSGVVGLV